MAEQETQFNKQEIGRLLVNLQRICRNCKRRDQPMICSISRECPVGLGRRTLAQYNRTGEQAIKDFDFGRLPSSVPTGATIERATLEEAYSTVHSLCKNCMFHTETCFMNIVYTLFEIALEKKPRKKPWMKPRQ